MNSRRMPRLGRFVPSLALLGVAACDIPSEPPIFQQTWLVPADSVQVSVSTLLPADVSLTGGGTAFTATTPTVNFNATLSTLCGEPECQVPGDVVVPSTPAFTSPPGVLATSIAFPTGVQSVTISGGFLQVHVTNDLGFDPLRPNGASAPFGTITFEISSGALTASTTFTGTAVQGLADGTMRTFAIPLPTGAYAGTIGVDVSFDVPAGGAATLNAANPLAVEASLQSVAISSADVVVDAKSVSATPEAYDLDDVDLGDLIEGGGFVLTVVNPFNAQAALTLTLAAPAQGGDPAVNIVKQFDMFASNTSVVDVILTKGELQSLVGKSGVTIGVAGTATGTGAGNTVTVTPTSRITVRTQLSLTINVGA